MGLSAGSRLGPYEIVAPLGAGGMGEVYRARDPRLNRDVAIKILRNPHAGAGRERLFDEARAASALNHPNIISIFDIGTQDDADYIVMEFCAGKTLDELIPRKGMRLPEALKIAVQVADAMAAAHRAGIVHRDLKPGNIMVGDTGQVKILDFGLARAVAMAATADAVTQAFSARPPSTEGGVAGTPAYMSPEQAEGHAVDARSDIFSFGSVLYEMLTGERAFRGDSAASTLSSILRDEPRALAVSAPDVPREVDRVLARCLRKDPARRFQTSADLHVALLELKEDSDSGKLTSVAAIAPARTRRRPWIGYAATAVVLMAVATGGLWMWRRERAHIPMPKDARVVPVTSYPGAEADAAISPDGNQVAFAWRGKQQDNWDIYVILVDGGTPLRLTTDPAADRFPTWSPDGRKIAFERVRTPGVQIITVPALGGPERVIATLEESTAPRAMSWSPDGRYIAAGESTGAQRCGPVLLVDVETGEITRITTPPNDSGGDSSAAFSPDGRTLAFVRRIGVPNSELAVMPLDANSRPAGNMSILAKGQINDCRWAPDGKSLLCDAYQTLSTDAIERVWLDDGSVQLLPGVPSAYSFTVARNAPRAAFSTWSRDVNIYRLPLSNGVASGPPSPLIASTADDLSPYYSPDGKRLVFVSSRSGVAQIWASNADGSEQVQLTSAKGTRVGSPHWSYDGKRIAYDSIEDGFWNIYVMNADGTQSKQMTHWKSVTARATFSHDGRWIYFFSNRTGQDEIYRMASDGSGEPQQITHQSGTEAFESADGRYLYYAHHEFRGGSDQGVWRVPVGGGQEEKVLSQGETSLWALAPDGIYYVNFSGPEPVVEFYSFATSKVRLVARLSRDAVLYRRGGPAFAISPDGKTIAFAQIDHTESDVMLVENFH